MSRQVRKKSENYYTDIHITIQMNHVKELIFSKIMPSSFNVKISHKDGFKVARNITKLKVIRGI